MAEKTSVQVKGKFVYHNSNLSALAVSNLISAILPDMQSEKAKKPVTDRPEFFSNELKIDSKVIHGELSIMDYVVSQANRIQRATNPATFVHLYQQGYADDLRFDDWVFVMNARLRPVVHAYAIAKDGQDVSATIKAIAKELED